MAVQCPISGNYHTSDEVNYLEIVAADNRPIDQGTPGRLLVTPFYGYAMPRIRYEIGDEAISMSHCPCGRPHNLISAIHGRISNLFHRPDGKKFRPERGLITRASEHLAALAVQIAQIEANVFEVRYKTDSRKNYQPDEKSMMHELFKSFGFHAQVRFKRVDSIPAKSRGKREDFICEYQK